MQNKIGKKPVIFSIQHYFCASSPLRVPLVSLINILLAKKNIKLLLKAFIKSFKGFELTELSS